MADCREIARRHRRTVRRAPPFAGSGAPFGARSMPPGWEGARPGWPAHVRPAALRQPRFPRATCSIPRFR